MCNLFAFCAIFHGHHYQCRTTHSLEHHIGWIQNLFASSFWADLFRSWRSIMRNTVSHRLRKRHYYPSDNITSLVRTVPHRPTSCVAIIINNSIWTSTLHHVSNGCRLRLRFDGGWWLCSVGITPLFAIQLIEIPFTLLTSAELPCASAGLACCQRVESN